MFNFLFHVCHVLGLDLHNFNRNDGSGIAQKTLKRVLKGWGQGSISTSQPQKFSTHDCWDGVA